MKPIGKFVITLLIGILAAGLDPKIGPAQAEPAGPDPASLLEAAIISIESCASISAKTRQRAEVFGKTLIGNGSYAESRSAESLKFRLEMKFHLGDDRQATMLEVCDGLHLWESENFQDPNVKQDTKVKPTVREVDVSRVRRELAERGELPKAGIIGRWVGLGGLSKTLRSLYFVFEFTTAQETQTEKGLPIIRLHGQWKPARLIQMLPEQAAQIQAGKPASLERLSPQAPHEVVLDLEPKQSSRPGAFYYLPRRIEYWRRLPAQPGSQAAAENRLLAAIDFFDVRVNVSIDPAQFQFDPSEFSVSHQTDRYLEMMKAK